MSPFIANQAWSQLKKVAKQLNLGQKILTVKFYLQNLSGIDFDFKGVLCQGIKMWTGPLACLCLSSVV